jgi:hypothetical protein
MGTSLTRGSTLVDSFTAPLFGDYTTYSLLVSRFMMALEKEKGLKLDTAEAGLRTACLTGVATTKLTSTANALTGGDLDEAVSGLLKNGLIASNVNGEFAPVAFSRVDAFRTGVLGTAENCYKRCHEAEVISREPSIVCCDRRRKHRRVAGGLHESR